MNFAGAARRSFTAVHSFACTYIAVPFLAVLCLAWSIIALPAYYLLPTRSGTKLGRRGIQLGFKLYVTLLRCMGAYRFDLTDLAELRKESGVILAPNHPHLIDALILLSCHPDIVCVMKTELERNVFLGAGARLARFIGNSPPRRMIKDSIAALKQGSVLLLFPEGTRSVRSPVNGLQLTVATIAKHARVPVLTVLIESDSHCLGKGWPMWRVPRLPITYRIKLGRRFNPSADPRQLTAELEAYFRQELANSMQTEWLGGNTADRVG